MFAYIKGILVESSTLHVVIEANGIGYKIHTPVSLFANAPVTGEQMLLYTSFVVRENSQTLFGFLSSEERDLFEALQGVSGIGPKLALCIVGHMSIKDLHLAVSGHDIAALSKIPGIGKKTAERLIIEMRDKLTSLFPSQDFSEYATFIPVDPKHAQINDAMSALINLGYNQQIAQKAIKKTLKDQGDEKIDLAKLITSALQNIN